jgi:hypothetical protein
VASMVATYGLPATLWGNEVVVIAMGDVVPVPAGAMTTGSVCDSAMVWGSCTFNCAVEGVERSLLPIVAVRVWGSTTVVASGAPFQSSTAVFEKFDPVTFSIWLLEPA